MALIYITGISGSGKSAVLGELAKQGFEAHGVDEEGFADWVDRETGAVVPFPHEDPGVDIHDWYRKHRWVLSEERIGRLKAQSDQADAQVFLAGVAEGEDKVWRLFETVIYLAVSEATLRSRIAAREDNHFGKTADEMVVILSWLQKNDGHYRRSGAATVDATRPLPDVVAEVLRIALCRAPA